MAASRSMLEALLARVQKRASEPRTVSLASPAGEAAAALDARHALETVPPVEDLSDDDIEDYDEELVEIIDDAEVIPQAAAAARAIEPAAFGASLDRRPGAGHNGRASAGSVPAATTRSSLRPASVAPAAALRPESISPRAIVATDVVRSEGVRRQSRVTSFIEMLDASLELGG
jgi:hypothetical protein